MMLDARIMRDVFIEGLCRRMHTNKRIFFLCADFGSPKLNALRSKFSDRFINVGIAEQNLINVATGLALEGFVVYAYAIAPFLTMRAFEQIRVNLSLQSQLKDMNINLVGVGAGLSYDVSGPTHHCLEDLSIMRTLPNILVLSPSDWVLVEKLIDYSIGVNAPKYLRFDGKPTPAIYSQNEGVDFGKGFVEIRKGKKVCLVSTGYMTHSALAAAAMFNGKEIGVIDVFSLRPFDEKRFISAVKKYEAVITIEEGFINKGGLDALVLSALGASNLHIKFKRMGFGDAYVYDIGNRKYLHRLLKLDEQAIAKNAEAIIKEKS